MNYLKPQIALGCTTHIPSKESLNSTMLRVVAGGAGGLENFMRKKSVSHILTHTHTHTQSLSATVGWWGTEDWSRKTTVSLSSYCFFLHLLLVILHSFRSKDNICHFISLSWLHYSQKRSCKASQVAQRIQELVTKRPVFHRWNPQGGRRNRMLVSKIYKELKALDRIKNPI